MLLITVDKFPKISNYQSSFKDNLILFEEIEFVFLHLLIKKIQGSNSLADTNTRKRNISSIQTLPGNSMR